MENFADALRKLAAAPTQPLPQMPVPDFIQIGQRVVLKRAPKMRGKIVRLRTDINRVFVKWDKDAERVHVYGELEAEQK